MTHRYVSAGSASVFRPSVKGNSGEYIFVLIHIVFLIVIIAVEELTALSWPSQRSRLNFVGIQFLFSKLDLTLAVSDANNGVDEIIEAVSVHRP